MKTNTLALLVLGIGLSTAWAADTVLFDDSFEGNNLDRWDGIISGAHHGTIVVDCPSHGGTTVTVSLPLAQMPAGSATAGPILEPA